MSSLALPSLPRSTVGLTRPGPWPLRRLVLGTRRSITVPGCPCCPAWPAGTRLCPGWLLPSRLLDPQPRSGWLAENCMAPSFLKMDATKLPLLDQATQEAGAPAQTKAPPPSALSSWHHMILPFFFPALGGLLFGYDIGATSGALLSVKDAVVSGTDWYNLSATATGLVVSGSLGGALLGSAVAFLVADTLGRRRELILAAGLYAVGALCSASAPSLSFLLLGRVIFGAGIGLAMHGAPMFIAETSPAEVRGTLISLKEAFIVGGILLGYLCSSAFVSDVGGWREMFSVGAPIALLMAAGMWWLPPSPRWLLLRSASEKDPGKCAALRIEAETSLARLRGAAAGDEEVQSEAEDILSSLEEEATKGGQGVGDASATRPSSNSSGSISPVGSGGMGELFQGANARALRIAGGLVVFQQITGQPSVLYYAASILQDAGFSAASDATRVSVLLGSFKLLMTGAAVLLVDKAGRRPLLLTGVTGLVLALLILGSIYQAGGAAPALSVAALLLYVGSYQVSFGPISWLMVSEIFALRVRGRAQSIATLLNFGSNAVVTFAFPPVQEALGQSGTFFLFALIGVLSVAFIYTTVPETKGLTLEDIQLQLEE